MSFINFFFLNSIVFGPHCLKKRDSDPVSELTDAKDVYDSSQLMIEEYDGIFSVSKMGG